jgi:predicted nucleotidyltransferase
VSAIVTDDPVLQRIRAALKQMYGERIERVVLYGSRARGDSNKESDYDIAVFLEDMDDFWGEARRLSAIHIEMLREDGLFIDVKPFRAGSYRDRTPLMHEIRKDGIDL